MARFSGVLLDLGGVVYVGETAVPGSVEAIARLRQSRMPLRFITNTTRRPLRKLIADLRDLGLEASPDEIFTPAMAARHRLAGRVPHLVVHPDLREDFAEPTGQPEVVVVGDAGATFSYRNLNEAFRVLESGAELLALAKNRSFKDADGAPSLDAGPFVVALEYASGREATVIGKPSEAFFRAALDSLGVAAAEAAMIGDDVEADVGGAIAAGLAGILVRTGKYKEGDAARIEPRPTAVLDDLAAAVDWILEP